MKVILSTCFVFATLFGITQSQLTGVVVDSLKKTPIPFVRLQFKSHDYITIGNLEGHFSIPRPAISDTLEISCIGYKTKRVLIRPNQKDSIVLTLAPNTTLSEIEVFAKKKNPAFRILKAIRDNETFNNPDKLKAYEYEVYNTLQFNVTNITDKFKDRALIKNMDFIVDYMDTLDGKNYLPAMLSESVSNYYYHRLPAQEKEIIKASRVTGITTLQLDRYTGQIHQNFNVYDNFIDVFNTDFMSPLAVGGRAFYHYKLIGRDTIDKEPCYHLSFDPKRKGDPLFQGEFWVTDSSYAIKRMEATIPKMVNINYVSGFEIEQNYEQVNQQSWFVTDENITVRFKLFNETKKALLMGVQVKKNTSRDSFKINQSKPIGFYVQDISILDSAKHRTDSYWSTIRHDSLNSEESGIITMNDSLSKNRLFRFYKKFSYFGYTGYWQTGPVETGNAYSFYNQNAIEGHRIMLSARTSNKFSRWHEISAFGIYGFKDKNYKYGASYRWKFKHPNREILRFAYKKRIEQLSLSSSLGDIGNSFSTLFSAGILDKLTLIDQYTVDFVKDWSIDMRTFNAIQWKKYTALEASDYRRIENGDTVKIKDLTSFQIRNQIMYTSDEKFISGSFERLSLGSKFPIISLTHTFGIKDFLDSEYSFQRFDFVWDHRPKIGVFGRLHYTFYAGKIFGTLPYPFLYIHQGNQTFYLQPSSLNLLNYYEFISDTWIGFNFEHQLKGFVLDRIPLVRKLKWRLVYTGKAVVGSIDPKHSAEMIIPDYSYSLSFTKPYMETSIGIENIAKFIRIDAIWRLSYNYHPDITKFGVKFTFTGDF